MKKYFSWTMILCMVFISTVNVSAELDSIQNMLDELNGTEEKDDGTASEETGTEPSELDELQAMLDELNVDEETSAPKEEPQEKPADGEKTETGTGTGVEQVDYVLLDGFDLATLNNTVALQVPSRWGSNAGVSDAMVSYSPANRSGATDPNSSTLSTIWYNAGVSGNSILGEYVDNIRKEDIFSDVRSEPFSVAGQEGISISYSMNVGTNSFDCRSACFVYNDILYTVEMYQGIESSTDYFPVYENVINSEAIMEGSWDLSEIQSGETDVPTPTPTEAPAEIPTPTPTEPPVEPPAPSPTETPGPAVDPDPEVVPAPQEGDLGDFTYTIHGHSYQFPTQVNSLIEGDLDVDLTLELSSEKDTGNNELANTLYFILSHVPSRELIGVCNLTGANAPMSAGVLTALVDTQALSVDLELPGGLKTGSPEALIPAVFPEFAGRAMDGVAGFRGNELLYACNVRDDGCNGYAIIRNDKPYCSALTIICEDGLIREINFQCLGSAVADSIFL